MSATSAVRSGCLVVVIATFAVVGFIALTAMNSPKPADVPAQATNAPGSADDAANGAARAAPDPACTQAAQLAIGGGLLKKGAIDSDGVILLTDARWTQMAGDEQESLLRCVAQEIAGGPGKTLKRLVVKNQRTGVTYATLDLGRFRIGE